jgi:surface protein
MGTRYNSDHQDVSYAHIDGGTSNPGYLTDPNPIAYTVFDNGTLTFYYDNQGGNRTGTFYKLNTGTEKPGWLTDATCYDVTTVVFDPAFANYNPATTAYWFNNMESLTEIKGMKDYLNTAHVKYMNDMFNGCRSMEVLDLSAFMTLNVNNMGNMFANCTSLTTILVGNEWKVSGVMYSNSMFTNCPKLVGMAGTTYDKNNTDKAYAHPDGGEANPGYLSMKMMYVAVEGQTMKFYYDGNFYSRTEPVYDVDKLRTASTDEHAFDQVVIAEFDPSFADARPTSTADWFYNLPKLSTFKGMREYLNTSEVRTMRAMFHYLLYVEKLDLSGFDTHNVQDMSAMFGSSSYLETIWVGDGWNTDNVIESTGMFSGCRRLVGGAGTKYDEGHTDVRYAHVDGGTSNPGYLTAGLLGDVNLDGKIDVRDMAALLDAILKGATDGLPNTADVNQDGKLDVRDMAGILNMILGN